MINQLLTKPEVIQYYLDNPVDFVREVIHADPDENQIMILNSVKDAKLTAVKSGHGVGKSATLSWIIIWYLYTHPHCRIPCTGPSEHTLSDVLWSEVAKWLQQSELKDMFVWTKTHVHHKLYASTWYAVARTASKGEALQGFHAEHILYLVDEASGVLESNFMAVLGALSTSNAKLIMCSNPTQLEGFFYEAFNKNGALFNQITIDCNNSRLVSKEYIQTIIDMFGKDSDVYRVRVAGEFPGSVSNALIPMDLVKQCFKDLPKIDVTTIDLGVDVARFGDDEIVIASVFNGTIQTKSDIYRQLDTMQTSDKVAEKIRNYLKFPNLKKIKVKVDVGGMGAGVVDRLRQLAALENWNKVEIYEINFGGAGGSLDDSVRYDNLASLMYGNVLYRLKKENLILWNDDEQTKQLTNRRYNLTPMGDIIIEKKDDFKKRGNSSPDRADALVLALWNPTPKIVGVI